MDLLADLREYGFSEKEGKVYLALLALGFASVNDIAEKADLVRTTTYDLLKVLREKGFVASTVKNKVLYFEAHHPEQLVAVLEEKKKKIQKSIHKLAKLKESVELKPRIELFEGKEGMKTVFREMIHAKKELFAYSNNREMLKMLPFFGPNFIKSRVEHKIPIKILSEDSATTKHLLQEKDRKELRETKILNKLKEVSINQYVFGDSVAIFGAQQDEPVGILITHKEFAHLQRLLFEELWKNRK